MLFMMFRHHERMRPDWNDERFKHNRIVVSTPVHKNQGRKPHVSAISRVQVEFLTISVTWWPLQVRNKKENFQI